MTCEEYWQAHRVRFVTLQSRLADSGTLVAFFESRYLLGSYLLFVFESASRPIVLTALVDYLVHERVIKDETVVDQMTGIIRTCLLPLEINEAVLMLDDVLIILAKALKHVPGYADALAPVVPEICHGITKLGP
jgi:hypothetical protein